MSFITFRINKSSDVLTKLNTFKQHVRNDGRANNQGMNAMLVEMERYLGDRWLTNFDTQGSIYGRWKENTQSTLQRKGPKPTLVDTETMRGHFIDDASQPDRRNKRSSVFIFNNDERYRFAQFGTRQTLHAHTLSKRLWETKFVSNRAQHAPPRKLVDINSADRQRQVDIVRSHAQTFVDIAWTRSGGG